MVEEEILVEEILVEEQKERLLNHVNYPQEKESENLGNTYVSMVVIKK